jgi:hypothetical protein
MADDNVDAEMGQVTSNAGRLGLIGIALAASPFVITFRFNNFQSTHVFGLLAALLGVVAMILATRDHPGQRRRTLALGAGSLALGLFWVGRMLGYL